MTKSRFTNGPIIAVLKQAEAGTPVPALTRAHGMSAATFYQWQSKFGGIDGSMVARPNELEEENWQLKNGPHADTFEFIEWFYNSIRWHFSSR